MNQALRKIKRRSTSDRTKFELNDKQKQLRALAKAKRRIMAEGGSRSGKTFEIVRQIIIRAIKCPSAHFLCRNTGTSAYRSLWRKTLPDVLKICFPEMFALLVEELKAESIKTLYIPCKDGGYSTIEVVGLDNKERVDKILGTECSTLYFNEASEMKWATISTLLTRLAENSDLKNKAYFDCNPPMKSHWSYLVFHLGLNPDDKSEKLANFERDYGYIQINPEDNLANISEDYIETLKALPKAQRERFLHGRHGSSTPGALWTYVDVQETRVMEDPGCDRYVVALDVATSTEEGSDETGLGVGGEKDNHFYLVEDASAKMTPGEWARAAIELYHRYEACALVVETNQGGNMIRHTIHQIDQNINIVEVHAKKGKYIRAEPVAALWEENQRRGHIVGHMDELEDQLQTYTHDTKDWSPDRLDWAVYAVLFMMDNLEGQSIVLE